MTCDVIVVDDRSRFPLHVWRHLSRSLGFGIGEVGSDGVRLGGSARADEGWIQAAPGTPLTTDDGRARIWWVRADSGWRVAVDNILQRGSGDALALIDVQGEPTSTYNYLQVYRYLSELPRFAGFPERVQVVSSYHPSGGGAGWSDAPQVHPKSRETLSGVMALVTSPPAASSSPPSAVRHVLVTGAGFEIRGQRGGFGMPWTREVLARMGPPFYHEGQPAPGPFAVQLRIDTSGYPLPLGHERAMKSAVDQDLDAYWSRLLESVVDQALHSDPNRSFGDEALLLKALERERSMREAFRRSLLLDDWGFLNQSLAAARLQWHAWLTTNYTQFSNRAIALRNDDAAAAGEPWRIIATAAEAATLEQEDAGGRDRQRSRYLFKLHGDIAHLETMAIAGHDKAKQRPLRVPIARIYEIYAEARRFLEESLGKDARVVWHIVGHRLKDRGLQTLLQKLHNLPAAWQIFVVVDPLQPEEARDWLVKNVPSRRRPVICRRPAAYYMAHLEREGLSDETDADKIAAWLNSLVERGD